MRRKELKNKKKENSNSKIILIWKILNLKKGAQLLILEKCRNQSKLKEGFLRKALLMLTNSNVSKCKLDLNNRINHKCKANNQGLPQVSNKLHFTVKIFHWVQIPYLSKNSLLLQAPKVYNNKQEDQIANNKNRQLNNKLY